MAVMPRMGGLSGLQRGIPDKPPCAGPTLPRAGLSDEWKLHGHDRPPDLPERLRAAGFVPEETETVVIAPVAPVAGEIDLPAGLILREVLDGDDIRRIATMEEAVWEGHHSWMDELADEREADRDRPRIFVVEAGDAVVSAAWVRLPSGTEFATLWGGATHPG